MTLSLPDAKLAAVALLEACNHYDTDARNGIIAATPLAELVAGLTGVALAFSMELAVLQGGTLDELYAAHRIMFLAEQAKAL